jgi:hypothetical protein
MSGTATYYTQAFSPLPGRCFRLVSRGNEGGGPTHCPEPPTWRGTFRARNGRRYTLEACEGHLPRGTSPGRRRVAEPEGRARRVVYRGLSSVDFSPK